MNSKIVCWRCGKRYHNEDMIQWPSQLYKCTQLLFTAVKFNSNVKKIQA